MNIIVLGNEGSWYVTELTRGAEARGHQCQRADFRLLTSLISETSTRVRSEQEFLNSADAVIVRTMPPGSLEQVVYRMDVLHRLQEQGVFIMNSPRAVECAVDKFLTSARLAATGLPTPRTIVCESTDEAVEAFEFLGSDVVVKPLFGSEGRGILRVSDIDLAHRVFRTLERTQSVLYLQEFIPHAGYDIRVMVLNGEIVGAMRRSNPTDFRTNVARQGTAALHQPTEQEKELAIAAAASVDACFAGIDLLYDPEGRCYVIEVNAVPGWRAFQRATGIDVADRVIQFLEQTCGEGRS